MLFQHNRIVFGTVHVLGSNNGLEPWSGLDPSDTVDNPRGDRLGEFQTREKAGIHWLGEIFDLAKETDSPGVVILIQANPAFELDRHDQDRAGFNGFINALRKLMLDYQKPVLLAHGHIHYLWIDKPLQVNRKDGRRERLQTLTRIQIPGSPFVRWIKVTIDPQSPKVFLLIDPYIHKLDSIPW